MALSAFDDPAAPPTGDALDATLGPAAGPWSALIADVRGLVANLDETWAFGGARYGWSLRLVAGKRVLVHLTPQVGTMLVGLALGEKAIATARDAGGVSTATAAIVDAAPRYAEGRGVRHPVSSEADLSVARELVRIKVAR